MQVNVVGITAAPGGGFAMVAQYAWEPYGTLAAADRNGPEFGNRVGHQGLFYYSFDSTNPSITAATSSGHGMYYNRNRWYSPKLGRFTTLDPNESAQLVVTALAMNGQALELLIEGFDPQGRFVGGMNLFVYAGSNPLRHGDPLGLIYDPFEEVDEWADDRAGNALYTLGTLNQGATLGLQASLEIASILLGLDVFQSVNVLMDGTGGFWDAMNIVMTVNPVGRLGKAGARIGRMFKWTSKAGKYGGKLVGHHTVPQAVLQKLSKEVANKGRVRGMKGQKNIWNIPEELHKEIHRGARGGPWNARWFDELDKLGGPEKATVDDVVRIRDMLVGEFGLGRYRP